jgi:hypothetical protein
MQLLRMLVVLTAFLCLHFRFVLYLRKPTGSKAARRMLMKLSPDYRVLGIGVISRTLAYGQFLVFIPEYWMISRSDDEICRFSR